LGVAFVGADTTTEWDAAVVARFLAAVPPLIVDPVAASPVIAAIPPAGISPPVTVFPSASVADDARAMDAELAQFRATLNALELGHIQDNWDSGHGLPAHIDGRLLAKCRARIGRDLTPTERRYVRAELAGRAPPLGGQ